MDSSAVTFLREGRRHTPDEQQDTGFNIEEFAVVSRADGVCVVREFCSPSEYRRPQLVVRCIARHKGQVLLCQRADEPRRGFWNTPGGFLESGETLRTAVIRETLEESGVALHAPTLAYIHKLPQLNQIVMTFLAEVGDAAVVPGKESLDARLFAIDSMPWGQLAFPTDSDALRRTFQHSPYRQRCLQYVECFWDADGRIFARQR
jgi:ADP-ribose pyrophosphatase YjhB (NUDIX family)